jgi:hypothetical protein
MMFRITQCAAPLAFLLLFATGFAFVGTTAEAAVGFVGSASAMERNAPEAREQQATPDAAWQKCTPTKTTVHC